MEQRLDDSERLARLRLIRSAGIGPLTYTQLLSRTGSAKEAITRLPDLTRQAGRRSIQLVTQSEAEAECAHGEKHGFELLTLGEAAYPASLAAIADPPPVLWTKGERRLLDRPAVAIVGARNASAAGREMTARLARELGQAGYVVTSGLARGIDGAAHAAALETGTVAVLAGGADSIYPPEHTRLYADIIREGLVISEQPLGMTARAKDFPKRNRIVSGLSLGVVVVEAAERSGTLITARLAAEQGREVFAVPGSPLDPRSRGTNRLIKRGACLIDEAGDIIRELEGSTGRLFEPGEDFLGEPEIDDANTEDLRERVLSLLSFTPTHRDRLIAASDASAQAVSMVLLDLVLEGVAAEETGGSYVLAADAAGM